VTMVFTDIVGSTALLAERGDGYRDLLEGYRRQVRGIAGSHGGVEVDTQGDAFFLVFRRASDAVSAAGEIVSGGVGVPVRIGVHTGEPSRAEEGYVGMDVHLAARIAASGSGGQILLSVEVADLVRRDLPADVSLRDIGKQRMKGLTTIRKNIPKLRAITAHLMM